ncbi:hypothetical protein [Oceanobacillus sp. CAU 1775]
MLQQIKLANWLLEVDVEKTREFYDKGIDVCDCLDCKNYVEACKQLDASLTFLFNELGINPSMPAHLSQFPTEEQMTKLYIGNYHLVGNLLAGEWSTSSDWNESNTIKRENFTFGFSRELEFVPEDYPRPVLQLDFEAAIPWVLAEDPD